MAYGPVPNQSPLTLSAGLELFHVAFANAPIGMVLADADLRVLQVNPALCTMLGYTEDELLARGMWEVNHPDDVQPNLAAIAQALAGEVSTYDLEKRYLHRDGHIVWGHLRGSLVRNADGAPQYFVSQIEDITARKTAEAALLASEDQFRVAFEDAAIGMAITRPDLEIVRVNRASCAILGFSEQELLETTFLDITHPEDRVQNADLIERALAGEFSSFEMDKRYIRKDGEIVQARLCVSLLRDADGTPRYFLSQIQDITARMVAEAKFRTLVEQLPAAVYLLAADEAQTTLYYSPHHETLTGVSRDEALARTTHWLEWVHPDDREMVATEVARAQAENQPFAMEYRIVRADGQVIWIQDTCDALRDEGGALLGWLGTMQDVTERVEAEEARGRLAAIVESAESAIISRTLDGTIASWNAAAERLYGYSAEEMLGQPITRFFTPGDPSARLVSAEALAREPRHLEQTRVRKDGQTFEASISLSAVRDRAGRVTGVASITRDVTARKQAEVALQTALEEAQAGARAKTLFLAMMSHELRTPLQTVMGNTHLLLHSPIDPLTPGQREDIVAIQLNAERMAVLIDQLLVLTQIEAGQLPLDVGPVDVSEIVARLQQDAVPQLGAKGLSLAVSIPGNLPPLQGDAIRVHQILLNLLDNAIKFTETGKIWLRASATQRDVVIMVRDPGIGIAPDVMPFVFDEFRQGDSSLTRRYGGAGLGLAISQRLATQMRGQLTVESRPNRGSTFTLQLPIDPGPGHPTK